MKDVLLFCREQIKISGRLIFLLQRILTGDKKNSFFVASSCSLLYVSYSLLDIAALYWIYLIFNFFPFSFEFIVVFWNLFYTPTALLFASFSASSTAKAFK
jgi:hypothetical protein